LLCACAGRPEREIKINHSYDNTLNCAKITEFHRNNENLVDRKMRQRHNTKEKNAKIVAAGLILFTPILLAADLRDVEKNEILGLKQRNEVLRDMAKDKGCSIPTSKHAVLYKALGG
jgi:hypothetical protein